MNNFKQFGYKIFDSKDTVLKFRGFLNTDADVVDVVEISIQDKKSKKIATLATDNFRFRALISSFQSAGNKLDKFSISDNKYTLSLGYSKPLERLDIVLTNTQSNEIKFPIGAFGLASIIATSVLFSDELDKFLYNFQQGVTQI